MDQISRRQFLRWLAACSGAVAVEQFLVACNRAPVLTPIDISTQPVRLPSPFPPTDSPVLEGQYPDTLSGTSRAITEPQTGIPDLVVSRGDDPEQILKSAVAALGGIERFVPKGAKVIIKPNVCVAYHSYEYAATTNPWVVGTLVKLCFQAGAKSVRVMDHPFGGTPEEAYAVSGIDEQVRAAGGKTATMSQLKFIPVEIQNGKSLTKTDIYDDILNADVLINAPVAKHHSLARLTLGMKNLMGTIKDRPAIHVDIGQRLADLTSRVYPALTVVDAIRILMNHGPTGGSLDDVKKMDTIIASPDIVAADSYAASLFGLQPNDLEYVSAGVAMGLGRNDLANLRIEEINAAP